MSGKLIIERGFYSSAQLRWNLRLRKEHQNLKRNYQLQVCKPTYFELRDIQFHGDIWIDEAPSREWLCMVTSTSHSRGKETVATKMWPDSEENFNGNISDTESVDHEWGWFKRGRLAWLQVVYGLRKPVKVTEIKWHNFSIRVERRSKKTETGANRWII